MVDYSKIKNQSDFFSWMIRVETDAGADRWYDRIFNKKRDLEAVNTTGWEITETWLIRNTYKPDKHPLECLMKGYKAVERKHKRNQTIQWDPWNENRFREFERWVWNELQKLLPQAAESTSTQIEDLRPGTKHDLPGHGVMMFSEADQAVQELSTTELTVGPPGQQWQAVPLMSLTSPTLRDDLTKLFASYPTPSPSIQSGFRDPALYVMVMERLFKNGNIEIDTRGKIFFIKGRRRKANSSAEALRLVLSEFGLLKFKKAELTEELKLEILKNTFAEFTLKIRSLNPENTNGFALNKDYFRAVLSAFKP